MRVGTANNSNTPTDTLTQLANDPEWQIRKNVAGNPNINNETITQLTNDPDWEVRINTTSNPNTPLAILKTLTTDKNHFVRKNVETRRQTNINNYINTLKGKEKTQAQLLAPTFTGWEDELKDVLTNLETKQHPQKYETHY